MSGPRQQRAIATRRRLIDSAATLFAERGYRGTRVADIARGANVAAGAMQFHFTTKAETAQAVVAEQHALMLQAAAEAAEGSYGSAVEEIIVISGRVAALIDASAVVRAGIRLSTEIEDDLFASPEPYLDWVTFAAGPLERGAREGELPEGLELDDLSEVLIAAFTGVRYFTAATTDRGMVPLLAKMWAAIFPTIGGRACTLEAVRQVYEKHGILPLEAGTRSRS